MNSIRSTPKSPRKPPRKIALIVLTILTLLTAQLARSLLQSVAVLPRADPLSRESTSQVDWVHARPPHRPPSERISQENLSDEHHSQDQISHKHPSHEHHLRHRPSANLSPPIVPAPPLRAALGDGYAANTNVEADYQVPLVYALAAVSRATRMPPSPSGALEGPVLLYVYAQGLTRRTSVRDQSYRMNVIGCVVAGERHELLTSTSGVYVCELPHMPSHGASVTLRISPDIYLSAPRIEGLAASARATLQAGRQTDGSFEIPSRAKWSGQYDSPPSAGEARYELCLMTQERLFPELIAPWVAYHRRLGVDRVFIYDNAAPSNLTERLAEDGVEVEVVAWPWPRSQFQAQNHFLLHARRRCVWTALMDVDEYLMVRPSGDWKGAAAQQNVSRNTRTLLKDYLRDMTFRFGASQILAPGITMGSSGHRQRPGVPPPEAYVHVTGRQDYSVKPIVLTEHALPATHVHTVDMFPGFAVHRPEPLDTQEMHGMQIGVAHYQGRSWEEYLIKAKGGRNSPQVQPFHLGEGLSMERPHWGYLAKRKQYEFFYFRDIYREVMNMPMQDPVLWSYKDRRKLMGKFESRPRLQVRGSEFVNIMMETDDRTIVHQSDQHRSFKLPKNQWNLYIHHRNST